MPVANWVTDKGDTVIIQNAEDCYRFFKIPAGSKEALFKGELYKLFATNKQIAIAYIKSYITTPSWEQDKKS